MTGIYVHIPFCEQRCYYCAFTVAVSPESAYDAYAVRLLREIGMAAPAAPPATVYFGGGTPSIVPASVLERVLRALRPSPVAAEVAAEVTVEVNPGTLSPDKLAAYRAMGVNRISLGAQSLQDEDLRRAGRLHSAAAVVADFRMLREAGFGNVNIDLIAGLPGQQLDVWNRNLDAAAGLRPDHISIYMLDLEERSIWGRRVPAVADDDDFARFYMEAEDRLARAGYVHYEISNWALPGMECRHNLGYWNGAAYRGFGVSAHSYDGTRRYWNTVSMAEYAERLDAGMPPFSGEEFLTPRLRLHEAFLLGLRQSGGFSVPAALERTGFEAPPEWPDRVLQLQEAGLVQFDGTILKLTAAGRLLASAVTEDLLWPAPSSTFEAIP